MDYVDPPLVIIRDREVGHGLVDTGTGQLRLGNIDLPANTTESSSHQSTVVILGNVGKILNTRLWARYKWLGEFHKATADHGFRVGAVWHRFNQVAMRGVGNVKNIPYGYIPWFVEFVNICHKTKCSSQIPKDMSLPSNTLYLATVKFLLALFSSSET